MGGHTHTLDVRLVAQPIQHPVQPFGCEWPFPAQKHMRLARYMRAITGYIAMPQVARLLAEVNLTLFAAFTAYHHVTLRQTEMGSVQGEATQFRGPHASIQENRDNRPVAFV